MRRVDDQKPIDLDWSTGSAILEMFRGRGGCLFGSVTLLWSIYAWHLAAELTDYIFGDIWGTSTAQTILAYIVLLAAWGILFSSVAWILELLRRRLFREPGRK